MKLLQFLATYAVHSSVVAHVSHDQASQSRAPIFYRRVLDNETLLPDDLTEDALDSLHDDINITDSFSTELNSTESNSTDALPVSLTNGTNMTAPPSIMSPSPSPFLSMNSTNLSISPSNAPSTTIPPTLLDLPTSSPILSTSQPTYGLLPIQPINIIVLTDVHSWVQGHGRHEPNLNADYGDILSFYQRLKSQIDSTKLNDGSTPDLYFVMNGDFVHGTILGEDPPVSLMGILEKMPYDVVTVGNDDIKSIETVSELMRPGGLVDLWGERLITSNVRVQNVSSDNDDLIPLGNNYKFLHGNQGKILALGFLYNIGDETSITVETVQEVIKQAWFTSLFVNPNFDAILVMAHMSTDDELITLLHDTLRKLVGKSMVIQFITGHTHTRAYVELDNLSNAFEAGRYLDTIGFISFDMKEGNCKHIFVNANNASIAQSLGMRIDEYLTDEGKELTTYIDRTFDHAGANHVIGCSPIRYRAESHFNQSDSLLRLYLDEVIPTSFLQKYSSGSHKKYDNILIQRLDWFVKYDLFQGTITMNDLVQVVPEDYTILSVSNAIKGKDILNIVSAWSNNQTFLDNSTSTVGISMPKSISEIDSNEKYNLYTVSKFGSSIKKVMNDLSISSFSFSPHDVYNGEKTMRTMWVDFIQNNWPYDDNDCECMKDKTCGNFVNANTGHSSSKPWEKPSPSSHGSTPVSPPTSSNISGPESSESINQSSGSNSSSNHSHLSGVFLLCAVVLAVTFYAIRTRRQGYTAAREATRNNDLELRVTPPPGHGDVVPPAGYGNMNPQSSIYLAPQFSHGSFV